MIFWGVRGRQGGLELVQALDIVVGQSGRYQQLKSKFFKHLTMCYVNQGLCYIIYVKIV